MASLAKKTKARRGMRDERIAKRRQKKNRNRERRRKAEGSLLSKLCVFGLFS